MKVLLIVILIIAISVGGCSCTSDEERFEEAQIDSSNIVEVNLRTRYFYGLNPDNNIEDREKFVKTISNKFGINLKVTGIGETGIYRQDVESFDGLIRINRTGMNNFRSFEIIEPITQYLENNNTWKNLPEYFKENAIYDGDVWAIPASTNELPTFYSRFVRKDWLDNLHIKPPETIEEYYEMAYKFTYEDPDGNQANDTIGFLADGLQGLNDIFNSYDCRMPLSTYYWPTWDPIENKYVDGLQQPNIVECLQFLNNCYYQKILNNSFMETGQISLMNEYYKGKAGSVSNFISYHDDIESRTGIGHEIITGLRGRLDEKIIPVLVQCPEFYVVPANMKNKEAVINKFVNVFLGNETGYFMGKNGIPDTETQTNDFTLKRDAVILHVDVENGLAKTVETPNIIQGHPVYSRYEVFYSAGEKYPENVISNYDRKIRVELLNEKKDTFYYVSDMKKQVDYKLFDQYAPNAAFELSRFGTKTIEKCIKGEVDISEAIVEYKKQAEKLGMSQVLNIVNNGK